MTLLSYYTDINITIVDGMLKDVIIEKALPKGTHRPEGGQLGCWREHLNMLKIVVEKPLETALILEADVDWDVRIKAQLTGISEHLLNATFNYPYGTSLLNQEYDRRPQADVSRENRIGMEFLVAR